MIAILSLLIDTNNITVSAPKRIVPDLSLVVSLFVPLTNAVYILLARNVGLLMSSRKSSC
jgi:hypothetical protein